MIKANPGNCIRRVEVSRGKPEVGFEPFSECLERQETWSYDASNSQHHMSHNQ